MMEPHKKRLAALILGHAGPSPEPGAPEDEGAGPDDGLNSAADDLIQALKGGDAGGVASALRSAFQMLEAEPHDEGGADNGPAPE